MADKSKIEWTDASWTPIRARFFEIQDDGGGKERIGWHCEHVSEGCRNCYAEQMNRRLGTGLDFKPGELYREEHKGYHNGEAKLFLDEEMLLAPLRWKKPRMIFVCSMTDLFADFVPDEWIDRVFAVMALAPQHTFQVLTKRAARMRDYMTRPHRPGQFITVLDDGTRIDTPSSNIRVHSAMCYLMPRAPARALNDACAWQDKHYPGGDGFMRRWPLPNVWLGVSTERQQEADERIPLLLQTPAAVRFVSAEPLLGPIDLTVPDIDLGIGRYKSHPDLDWVIVGGESGSNARPMHPEWARGLRDQCEAAGVAFFFKQWGEWEWFYDRDKNDPDWRNLPEIDNQMGRGATRWHNLAGGIGFHGERLVAMRNVGKKSAGRLLDGIEHNAMPERRA